MARAKNKTRSTKPRHEARPPHPPARAAAAEPGPDRWETSEETLVFPADPLPDRAPAGRFVLPASGTAEEILARAEMRDLASSAPQADLLEAEPAPAAPATLSFFSSAQSREEKTVVATEHLATFFLDREEYGVDVKLVQEIIRVAQVTPVPRAPEFIRGVINLRGRIIPVIDLKRKLGLGEFNEARASRVVVVKVRDRLIGLLVDGASQVLKVPVSVIEAAPEEVVEIDANFIRGVAKLESRLIILIDLIRVLAVELRDAEELARA